MEFYKCAHCGEIVLMVKKACCTPACCGKPMELLSAGSVDASKEKHVPVVEVVGEKVIAKVGAVEHPMAEDHYIEFIAAEKKEGFVVKYLKPGEKPEAEFCGASDIVAIYAYCNLHGLWKTEL